MSPTLLLTYAVAFGLAVVAAGRFTRLVVHDDWPPMVWLRERYLMATCGTTDPEEVFGWGKLVTCPFCWAPWPVLVDLGWAAWSGLDTSQPWGVAWWLANLWFAGSYLAAMVVLRDEPPEDG